MKKIIGILVIASLVMCYLPVASAIHNGVDQTIENVEVDDLTDLFKRDPSEDEEKDNEENELNRKLLIVMAGNMKICWEDKELYGFGLIIYNDGEISTFNRYSINFEGLPFFIHKGISVTFCLYKPA